VASGLRDVETPRRRERRAGGRQRPIWIRGTRDATSACPRHVADRDRRWARDGAGAPERPRADGPRRVHAAGDWGRSMTQVAPQMRILVAIEAQDFRKGIDGLARVCREVLETDPFGGTLFVFRNRRGTALKCLVYDSQGFWLA